MRRHVHRPQPFTHAELRTVTRRRISVNPCGALDADACGFVGALPALILREGSGTNQPLHQLLRPTQLLRGGSISNPPTSSQLIDEDMPFHLEGDFDDDAPTELIIDGDLLGDDELLSTSGTEVTGNVDSEGLIGCMDDLELLMEQSLLGSATTSETCATQNSPSSSSCQVPEVVDSATYTFSQLTEMVLGLLPSDASSVPLTSITPGLDDAMEFICERYGSLLSFLKMNNAKVVIESKAGGKFFVRRVVSVQRQAELATEAERGQALRRASQKAEAAAEEAARQRASAPKRRPPSQRIKLQQVGAIAAPGVDDVGLMASFLEAAFPENAAEDQVPATGGRVISVLAASQSLDQSTKDAIKAKYGTVTKFVKSHSDIVLDVSWDGLRVAYPKGTAMSVSDLVAPQSIHAKVASQSAEEDEFSADDWAVDLGVGEDADGEVGGHEDEDFASALPTDEDAKQFTSSETADKESFYSGVTGGDTAASTGRLSTAELRAIPAAPAAPVDAMSASTLVNVGSDALGVGKVPPPVGQSPPLTKEMATRLEEAHTQLAESKGWKTPRAMLDLFVECVPTYFVAISHLTVPAALQEAVGKNTLFKVFKAYAYYFEMKVEDGTHFVRLRDIVEHPMKGGVTDELYAHVRGKKTRIVGQGAFPVLNRWMDNRTGSLSDYIHRKKRELERKPARLRIPEPPVRRALRRAIRYDALTKLDDALVERVKAEAYAIKADERARKMKLAVSITTSTKAPSKEGDGHAVVIPTASPVDQGTGGELKEPRSRDEDEGAASAKFPPPVPKDPAIEAITMGSIAEELFITPRCDFLFYPPLPELVGGTPNTPSPPHLPAVGKSAPILWPVVGSPSSLDEAAAARGEWVESTSYSPPSSTGGFTAGFGGGTVSSWAPSSSSADSSTTVVGSSPSAGLSEHLKRHPWVRLRPFWTAPHSTAEYTLATSPYGRDTVHPIASHVRSAGLWSPMSKVLERVTLSAARKVQDEIFFMNADRFNRPSTSSEPESFAASLPSRFRATDSYEDVPATATMSWSNSPEQQQGYAKAPVKADRLPYITCHSPLPSSGESVDMGEGDISPLLSALQPYFPTRLVDLLRLHGGVTWVDCGVSVTSVRPDSSNPTPTVRKFTGFVDLDDVEHSLVDELRYALVTLRTNHKDSKRTEFTLDEISEVIATSYKGMLSPAMEAGEAGSGSDLEGRKGDAFISVPLGSLGGATNTTLEVPILKNPPYHRLLRFLSDHKKFFDVRVEEKVVVEDGAAVGGGSLEGALKHARQESKRARERERRRDARAAAGFVAESDQEVLSLASSLLPVAEGDVATVGPRRTIYVSAANIFGRQTTGLKSSQPAAAKPTGVVGADMSAGGWASVAAAVKAHEADPDCNPAAAQFAASATHYMQDLATAAAMVSPARYKHVGNQPQTPSTPSTSKQQNPTPTPPPSSASAKPTTATSTWDPRSVSASTWNPRAASASTWGSVGKKK